MLTRRYRTGEFDGEGQPKGGRGRRRGGEAKLGATVRVFARTRAERRRAKRLKAVDWLLYDGPPGALTPAQHDAAEYFYTAPDRELNTVQSGAEEFEISKQAFEERLRGAERRADELYRPHLEGRRVRVRAKRGRPNARNLQVFSAEDPESAV